MMVDARNAHSITAGGARVTTDTEDDTEQQERRTLRRPLLAGLLGLGVLLVVLIVLAEARMAAVQQEALSATERYQVGPFDHVRVPDSSQAVVQILAGSSAFGEEGSPWWQRIESRSSGATSLAVMSSWDSQSVTRAAMLPRGTELLVLMPGEQELRTDPVALAGAVTRAISAAGGRSSNIRVLLVAPPVVAGGSADLARTLQSAAALTSADFVDLGSAAARSQDDDLRAAAADRLAAAIQTALGRRS